MNALDWLQIINGQTSQDAQPSSPPQIAIRTSAFTPNCVRWLWRIRQLTMTAIRTNCVLSGRKDLIYLRKRICERNGLLLEPIQSRLRFGYVSYCVEIPSGYSKRRAVLVARAMKLRSKTYKLSHVANALLSYAGRPVGPRPTRLWWGPTPRST